MEATQKKDKIVKLKDILINKLNIKINIKATIKENKRKTSDFDPLLFRELYLSSLWLSQPKQIATIKLNWKMYRLYLPYSDIPIKLVDIIRKSSPIIPGINLDNE